MALTQRSFAGLVLGCDSGDLPLDPFARVLPLELDGTPPTARKQPQPDVLLRARAIADPQPSPATRGALPVLFHGKTRCFKERDGSLVLWDGASSLRIMPDGRLVDALVHAASLERSFHFSSVTVLVALYLALRAHGLFHLHAAGAVWADGTTWLVPGDANAGKSTLALALFCAGANFLSDDALLVRGTARGVEVHGWTRRVRITARTAAAFPALAPLLAPCPEESLRDFELDPRAAFPGRGRAETSGPFTLLFPRIADTAESTALPLARADAFGRLLQACAWVASEHVSRRDEQLAALGRLVDSAPAFEVAVGSRILSDPSAAVDEIRAQLR